MSRLRLTGGRARGRSLSVKVGPGVRPTTDRMREALFSILGQDLVEISFLDAFGGSGVVALEAWSRGAMVTLMERDRRALSAIKRSFAELGATVTVRPGDVMRSAGELGAFDIVFADPPYSYEPEPVLEALACTVRETLVYEHDAGTSVPGRCASLALDRTKVYGNSAFSFYRLAT